MHMKLSDLTRDKDPLFDLLDSLSEDESDRRKKKKKKKKKESKAIKSRWMSATGVPDMSELRDMSKSDLKDYIVKMGIKASAIDLTSKKAMRNCIMEHFSMSGSATSAALSAVQAEPRTLDTGGAKVVVSKERPPYWFDEDTGEFVIANARDTDSMNCYNGMSALGEIRRRARPEDEFGTLMDTLTKRIVEEAKKPRLKAPYIEAEFEVLDEKAETDSKKALPSPKDGKGPKKK